MNVTYVIVSEKINDSFELKTLAIWGKGKIRDNIKYNFLNLPCGTVINEEKLCCYPQKIQEIFPDKTILQNMKAESYLGMPLLDEHHQVIGVLCVVNNKILANPENTIAMMKVFATRATSELLRQRAEIARRHTYDELESRVKEATEELRLRTAELVEANTVLEREIQEKIVA
ncbi:MAG: GAF domain-containing protein [Okeania sp. SIO2D1]|nr:GAF domain-containing protein [Okeania sp. SIO2D1]